MWAKEKNSSLCPAAYKDKDAALEGREEPQMTSSRHWYLSRFRACDTNTERILQRLSSS